MRGRHLSSLVLTALLVFGNVVLFNVLVDRWRGVGLDLTEDRVYRLADETIELLREPEEPVEAFFYFSPTDRLHEKLRSVSLAIQDRLLEMSAASEGKLAARLVEWDRAEKEVQDRATEQFGVRPMQLQVQTADEAAVRNTYFSLVVAFGDQSERFDGRQLWKITPLGTDIVVEPENVEYLVAKAVHKVVRGFNSIGAALATANLKAEANFYFSPVDELPESLRKAPTLAEKVAKKLAAEASGRFGYTIEDPTGEGPAKEALRARLESLGLQDLVFDPKKPGFWSWVVVKVGKTTAPIPIVTSGDDLTESDVKEILEGVLKQLTPGFLTVVGVSAPDPEEDPMARMMGRQAPPAEFSDLREILAGEFEVRTVDAKSGKPIPRDVSVLLLLRPTGFSERALYEIDQFLMRGGRLVVCADPFGFDMQAAVSSRRPETKRFELGGFKDLLRTYGVDVGDSYLLDVDSFQLMFMDQTYEGGRAVPISERRKFPYMLAPLDDAYDRKHPIVDRLHDMILARAAPVSLAEAVPAAESRPALPGVPEGVEGTVLLRTSAGASTTTDVAEGDRLARSREGYAPPPAAKSYGLAVALKGRFPSHFADKPIPPAPEADAAASRPSDESRAIKKSSETTIVVVGDADFISPVTAYFFQLQSEMKPNYAFLRNALDFGGDAQRLTAIRGREARVRPLSELVRMTPEKRDRSQALSRAQALGFPILAVLLLGVVRYGIRRSQASGSDAPRAEAAGAAR
jgi:ABC-2 type transport system permease protein